MTSKNNSKTLLIIPAYNEEKKISKVVKLTKRYVSEVLVIDDGSTDRTTDKASKTGCTVLTHPFNLGQGAALETGFEYARQNNFEYLVTFDGDGQFNPSEIPLILTPIQSGKYDISLGSRFMGNTINMPKLKKLILKLGVLFTYTLSDIKLTDTHNGFRALNKKAFTQISLKQNRMSHASEMLDQIKRLNLRFVEVPVTVTYTIYSKKKGQSVLNSLSIISNMLFDKIFS